jgi:hypothetical protein
MFEVGNLQIPNASFKVGPEAMPFFEVATTTTATGLSIKLLL